MVLGSFLVLLSSETMNNSFHLYFYLKVLVMFVFPPRLYTFCSLIFFQLIPSSILASFLLPFQFSLLFFYFLTHGSQFCMHCSMCGHSRAVKTNISSSTSLVHLYLLSLVIWFCIILLCISLFVLYICDSEVFKI